jgi:hypothetical protein
MTMDVLYVIAYVLCAVIVVAVAVAIVAAIAFFLYVLFPVILGLSLCAVLWSEGYQNFGVIVAITGFIVQIVIWIPFMDFITEKRYQWFPPKILFGGGGGGTSATKSYPIFDRKGHRTGSYDAPNPDYYNRD